jgi:TolB-like protein
MYKKLVVLVLFIIFSSHPWVAMAYEKEIKELSAAISADIVRAGKKTIAVADFLDLQGNVNELGRFIAEELAVELTASAKGFEVIDRTHLKTILAEHKLSMTGLVDPNTVKRLGQIIGADAIVTGSVTPFGDSIRVSCKVIATDTARVIAAAKIDIPKTKAIEELLARGIGTGAGTPGAPTPGAPRPTAKAQPRVEVNNILFEVQACDVSVTTLTCSLWVTNNGDDDKIFLRSYALSIFDDLGNEYKISRIQLANKEGRQELDHLLVSGVPAKLILRVEGFSEEARMVSLIKIGFYISRGSGIVYAQLRNIPLSRR